MSHQRGMTLRRATHATSLQGYWSYPNSFREGLLGGPQSLYNRSQMKKVRFAKKKFPFTKKFDWLTHSAM